MTQGAIRALRADREVDDEEERRARYGRFADPEFAEDEIGIDVAETGSIRDFQAAHGLEPDGVIGPRTQLALKAIGAGAQHARPGPERHPHGYRRWLMGSGLMSTATIRRVDADIDREIDQLLGALEDGPRSTDELAEALRARRWGPGRFKRAVRVAVEEGRLVRVGGHGVALADPVSTGPRPGE